MKEKYPFFLILIALSVYACFQFVPSCQRQEYMAVAADTSYLHILKAHSAMLNKRYHEQVYGLDKRNDILQAIIQKQKAKLSVYKSKAEGLEQQLRHSASLVDQKHVLTDSITPIVETYIDLKQQTDSTCASTIDNLEQTIENKDQEILLCNTLGASMLELSTQQQTQITALNEQLKLSYRQQKRKRFHNRILASGLLVVSGIAAALLISKPYN